MKSLYQAFSSVFGKVLITV